MSIRTWISRILGSGRDDDESAEAEEYRLPDAGGEDLREHPAPSYLGGFESPGKDELDLPER